MLILKVEKMKKEQLLKDIVQAYYLNNNKLKIQAFEKYIIEDLENYRSEQNYSFEQIKNFGLLLSEGEEVEIN